MDTGRGDKGDVPVSYTHPRAHETPRYLVCRLLLEKKKPTTPAFAFHLLAPLLSLLSLIHTSYPLRPFRPSLSLFLFPHPPSPPLFRRGSRGRCVCNALWNSGKLENACTPPACSVGMLGLDPAVTLPGSSETWKRRGPTHSEYTHFEDQ